MRAHEQRIMNTVSGYYLAPTSSPSCFNPLLVQHFHLSTQQLPYSGLITFSWILPVISSPSPVPALLLGRLLPSTADVEPKLLDSGEDGLLVGLRWRTVGVGKLFRLSTASTVRWKRRKRV